MTMDDLALFRRHAAKQEKRFGMWDCCLLCADWFQWKRGDDPGAGFRGRYSTEQGAGRMIQRYGGLIPLFATKLEPLGAVRVEPDSVERGDIVVVEWPDGVNPGVMLAHQVVMSAHDRQGVVERHLSLGHVIACWRV